ncbi:protein RGF1 INDUCIBLE TRANSCRIPTION FACTOR 1-like isoform X2 [Nymphaea colorata]|uniref:protein RGF1 INDUCIBLE TRANSCRIPTION FACTOR 1-like isoform X2 n=1 Tax=Nymphaea colorata TaxID=210225 RepID=UPI00129DB059|nr:protein RGF1 INDUCIBLE TRANSCRIPTION FACTOR 1-like isoform X2 [Nymphaea colorata]
MGYAILGSGDLAWIEKLLKVTFFVDCSIHGLIKKNMFCIHCGASLCSQCTLKHCSHPLIQIRRYLYNDVVRLEDMRNLVDCSHIQRYIVNGYQAVFLNRQARTGQLKDMDNCCRTCKKMLQHSYHYCSIASGRGYARTTSSASKGHLHAKLFNFNCQFEGDRNI